MSSESLTQAPADAAPAYGSPLSPAAVVRAVARRGGPRLVEAMVVPAVLFYTVLETVGVGAAYATALAWTFSAIALRQLTHRPVTGLHLIVAIGLMGRTALALATDSTFLYFAQPVLGSAALAAVFLVSIALGRPLIARLADEFCPLDADAAGRHGVARLFRNLTYLWAAVIVAKGALTLVLLLTLPLSAFVVTKTLGLWALTVAAIAATFVLSYRTTSLEHLVPVSVSGGRSRFVVTASGNAIVT
jgi:intracellular septation protein A